eukprot:TRINITY_DN24356_c0_g2_i1.p1 TRINITY_DN24356_c0_g2~~TRINITY_DN24356_c0_g2_i1.p1  ORF type:complete len:356 (-),score=68.94 TRINITY_DN24356_c0_g2_i1:79-1146(-)
MFSVQCMACHEAGKPLEPWTYDIPEVPPEGHVDVEISYCGICGSDIHQLQNSWGVACFPLVPGHEIIGTVAKLGAGVSKFSVGQRVGIGVQRSNCGACSLCSAKLEQLCPSITKTYAGPGKDKGGFAQYIRYPAAWTFVVPESIPSELAAPLLCAGITTFSPLKRHCRAGMTVGIVGIGGLGHLALQYARAMGCSVVAISTSDSKREEAASFGATSYLVSKDAAQMAVAKSTLDVILNTASGVADIDAYLGLLKPRGVMVYVGLPEKDAAHQPKAPWKVFMQSMVPFEKSLTGSYLGPFADYEEMFAFSAEHKVLPKIELMKYEEVNEACKKVQDGEARYRVVLDMRSGKAGYSS